MLSWNFSAIASKIFPICFYSLGIIAMAMCPSISMGFALCFLLGSAALRIREFILLRSVSILNKHAPFIFILLSLFFNLLGTCSRPMVLKGLWSLLFLFFTGVDLLS